jgi:chorismate mutase/prephenate dehydratase
MMNEPKRGDSLAEADALAREDVGEVLERLRAEIDGVDLQILELLNERARIVQRVGGVKRETAATIYRAARERDLVAALAAANPGPFPNDALPHVFREIVSATRSLEARLRVAYLGPEGTYCHIAARQTFGSQPELVPHNTIPEVFAAVERGAAEHGVVPVENTTEGVVTQTLDTFVDSDVPICGESLLRVSHDLLSRSGRLEDIRRVVSHPQGLAQCRIWVDRHLPGAARVPLASTAAAGREALEDPATAAIGSALLGQLLGLETCASAIEDRRDNTTRFLVIGGEAPEPSGQDVTSVVFTVRKAQVGALHALLQPFAEHGVNVMSIQSRPLRGAHWEYLFFLDVEGHRSQPAVERALQAASGVASSAHVLGSFPRAARRGED